MGSSRPVRVSDCVTDGLQWMDAYEAVQKDRDSQLSLSRSGDSAADPKAGDDSGAKTYTIADFGADIYSFG